MPIPYIHSFARQLLAEQNCKIFSNDVEILQPLKGPYGGRLYEVPEVDTFIPIGTLDFKPSEQIIKITAHQKLMDLGFKIVANPFRGWFPGQKQRYSIVKVDSIKTPVKDIPPDHAVEYDLINKTIRLKGRNAGPFSIGDWVSVAKQSRDGNRDQHPVEVYLEDMARMLGEKKEVRYLPIKEIVVMLGENGWIICIEEQANEPCIGIVGARRMGNSFFMHALTDRAYWKWNKHIAVLNDSLDETDTWCLPWVDHPSLPNLFIRSLTKFHEPTAPLPCIYLTPNSLFITEDDLFFPREVGFRISLPFKDMILDWDNFTKGNERWTFKNSLLYFRQLLFNEDGTLNERLTEARSFEEIELLMKEKWFDENGNVQSKYDTIYMKVHATMRDIWNFNVLDASSGIPARWKVELKEGHVDETDPFVAALMCNLVPVLLTRKVKNLAHFAQEFKYRLNQIFRAQVENKYFKKHKIQTWLVIDEILSIAATDNRSVAAEEIEKVVRESGPARIGFIYRAQNYNKVLRDLRKNTGYCFAFKQDDESAKAILRDFGHHGKKSYLEELTSLKRHQLIGFTNNRFIGYDPTNGDRHIIDGNNCPTCNIAHGPVRGTSLPVPPMSMHKPPKDYGT